MPYKNISELPAEVKENLTTEQQQAFLGAFNSAIEEGKTEEEAFKIGYAAAKNIKAAESRMIRHYKVLSPGKYSPSPEPIEITAEDVQDFIDAVNIKHELGVPVAIKYAHRDGLMAIPVGRMSNGKVENGEGFVDLEVLIPAEYDGIQVASINQICDGLERGILQGSMEAFRKYQSEAYTGKRVFGIWPTAWAVLPAGEQPAVPPKKIAAGESMVIRLTGAPQRGNSPTERGQEMTLEEALKEIARLKEELAELKKSKAEDASKEELEAKDKEIADLKAEVQKYENKAAEDLKEKADTKAKEVLETRVLAANREAMKADLDSMDSERKLQFCEMLEKTLPEIKAKEPKTGTGDSSSGAEGDLEARIEKQQRAIIKAADDHKLRLDTIQGNEQATEIAMRDNPELFKE